MESEKCKIENEKIIVDILKFKTINYSSFGFLKNVIELNKILQKLKV
jgi:hypothetical protein